MLPTVVVATAFLALLPAGCEHGVPAILAAHVFFNFAVVARIVGGAWATARPARVGGGRCPRRGAVAPRSRDHAAALAPALSAAGALTFLFCFTSFGVILILGGPGRATLETEIYHQAARLLDLRAAAALSLLQLGAVALVLAVGEPAGGSSGGRRRRLPTERDVLRRADGPRAARLAVVLGLGALLLGLPLAVLVRRSLGDWGALFDETAGARSSSPGSAAVYSIAFASAAALIALVVGGLAAVALAADGRPGSSTGSCSSRSAPPP